MSSYIQVQRICQYCGKEFTARTTETRYCSRRCNGKAYKAKKRLAKVEASDRQTMQIKIRPITELNAKDFLTVREVATLMSCSKRSVYLSIQKGYINAVNLGQRITRVKRSDLDRLFERAGTEPSQENTSRSLRKLKAI
jgi:excisionase family DNA binding protein